MNRSKLNDRRQWLKWYRSGAVDIAPGKPRPCDPDIYRHGKSLAALEGRGARRIELLVRRAAFESDTKLDWHYSGGVAHVLHLGNADERERAITCLQTLCDSSKTIRIMQVYEMEGYGLYRSGVSEVPQGAIASFMDLNGQASFMIASS